jgi:hypothetical protein
MAKTTEVAQTTQEARPQIANPFLKERAKHINAGTVEIEAQRAIAEVQASLMIAKARPRDPHQAFENMLTSCSRQSLASKAFYSYPRAGQTITGPSIRLAEELARIWGNMEFGTRELSQRDGETEMEVFAWDLETNMKSSQRFTVKHEISTRNGVKELTDQRDIYELGANLGARRLRSRILAILPPDYVDAAIQACAHTLTGGGQKPFADRIKDMITAFGQLGVTKKHIEDRLGAKLTEILPDQFTELVGIYNAIKTGERKASEYFGAQAAAAPEEESKLGKINAAAAAATPTPAPAAEQQTPPPAQATESNEELI